MWVTHKEVAERLDDIQIPFNDVKNVLEEIHFQDETTRSRCRGWLVLKSRKYLQADIFFPGCKYDCTRLTIRGRTGMLWFSHSFLFLVNSAYRNQKLIVRQVLRWWEARGGQCTWKEYFEEKNLEIKLIIAPRLLPLLTRRVCFSPGKTPGTQHGKISQVSVPAK